MIAYKTLINPALGRHMNKMIINKKVTHQHKLNFSRHKGILLQRKYIKFLTNESDSIIQVFKMLSILLILCFTKIKANSVNNLPTNLEKLWVNSQALIYHNPETFKDFSIQEPDCLGNLIATNYIITAASCFMFTFEILKYHETNNERPSETNIKRPTESEENAIISRSIKNIDIKKTRIVKVPKY